MAGAGHALARRSLDRDGAERLRARGRDAHASYVRSKRELLCAIAEQLDAALWVLDGSRSPVAWVANTYGIRNDTARDWVRQAEGLVSRPVLAEAMSNAEVSLDEAEALLTLTEDDPTLVEDWLNRREREGLSPHDLKFEARKFVSQKTAAEGRARYLTVRPSPDEKWMDLRGRVDAVEGAELLEVLDGMIDHRTKTHLMGEARANALLKLARQGPSGRSVRRPTLVVHVEQDTLIKGEGVAMTEMGTFLDPDRVRTVACDAYLEHIIESEGRPIAIWAESRIVPAPLRRAIIARDKYCQGPGCGGVDNLEVHHIIPWYLGGKTVEENLLLLCAPCHINFHRRHVWVGPRRGEPKQPRASSIIA